MPLVSDGSLNHPGTRIFLGGQDIDANPLPGFRVGAGYALSDRWGVETSVFYLPPRTATRSVSSSGKPGSANLNVPYFNPTLPWETLNAIRERVHHEQVQSTSDLSFDHP